MSRIMGSPGARHDLPRGAVRFGRVGGRGRSVTGSLRRPGASLAAVPGPALLAIAALVVASLLGGAYVWSRPAPEAERTVFDFAPEQYDGALVVARQWAVDRQAGKLQAVVRLVNGGTSDLADVEFDEVLPRSVVRSDVPADVEPAELVSAAEVPVEVADRVSQVLTYRTGTLEPNRFVELAYEVELRDPTGDGSGSDAALLADWAADQAGAREAYLQEVRGGAAPDVTTLENIVLHPTVVRMRVRSSFPLMLTGTMSDGSAASATVLLGVTWTSSDTDVVHAADGALLGRTEGEATVSAAAGVEEEHVRVRVLSSDADTWSLVERPDDPFEPPVLAPQGSVPVVERSPLVGPVGGTPLPAPPVTAPSTTVGGGGAPSAEPDRRGSGGGSGASPTPTGRPPSTRSSTTSADVPPVPPPGPAAPAQPAPAPIQPAPAPTQPAPAPTQPAPPPTQAPTTQPPTTQPPTTQPPTTLPPTTLPPPTLPPTTAPGPPAAGDPLGAPDREPLALVDGSPEPEDRR